MLPSLEPISMRAWFYSSPGNVARYTAERLAGRNGAPVPGFSYWLIRRVISRLSANFSCRSTMPARDPLSLPDKVADISRSSILPSADTCRTISFGKTLRIGLQYSNGLKVMGPAFETKLPSACCEFEFMRREIRGAPFPRKALNFLQLDAQSKDILEKPPFLHQGPLFKDQVNQTMNTDDQCFVLSV